MNKTKITCIHCNKDITSNNIERHQIKCILPKVASFPKFNLRNTGKKGRNQFSKAKDEGRPVPTFSQDTIAKILATKERNGTFAHTEESKRKLSASMKRAVENNPESYTSSNRGRTKQIIVDGIKFQGHWEVDFYLWAKDAGLNPQRATQGFKYNWNGERTYFPDFYIESKDLYVEVKGYETERDRAKWDQFPKELLVVREQTITDIRNDTFTVDRLNKLLYNM
jgi:hypothetical protein